MKKPVVGISYQVQHKEEELYYVCSKNKGCAVTMQLICAFVFAYAKNRFSHHAHLEFL